MNLEQRKQALMPGNVPKWVRCYDNGGETLDRYTVVFTKKAIKSGNSRSFMYLGMNAAPFHPQGIGQHGESKDHPCDRPTYKHLGKKITFEQLPEDCKKAVIDTYTDLWDLEQLYKVVKVFRKSARRKVLARGITRDKAISMVESYKSSDRSMVIFDKQN